MRLLRHFSPIRAYRDLRLFLAQRRGHEIVFAALAFSLTLTVIAGFVKDSHFVKPYHRDIIYFESWSANRSEAEILAQQKIDMAEKARRDAEIERKQQEHQAELKRLDDKLKTWGF